MATDHNVRIVEWPKNKALLEHHFVLDKPCPVGIVFEKSPAFVELSSSPNKPVFVNMNMNLATERPIPLCIKFCEPICAKSDYQIGINLFGKPLAQITVKGTTRIGQCTDKDDVPEQKACQDFNSVKPGDSRDNPFTDGHVTITAQNESSLLQFSTPNATGDVMLVIAPFSTALDFDVPVDNPEFDLFNTGNPVVEIIAFSGGNLVHQVVETFTESANTRRIYVNKTGITRIEIHISRDNKTALGQICYTLSEVNIPTITDNSEKV